MAKTPSIPNQTAVEAVIRRVVEESLADAPEPKAAEAPEPTPAGPAVSLLKLKPAEEYDPEQLASLVERLNELISSLRTAGLIES